MLPSQRAHFDIPSDVAYLNAAGWSPLPRATQQAAQAAVLRKGQPWKLDADFREFPARAGAGGGRRADRRGGARCRAGLVGRLRRRHRGKGAVDPARRARARAGERPHLAGARMGRPRRRAWVHRRDDRAAGERRLDLCGAGRHRAAGRAARARLDLLHPLVGWRTARHGHDIKSLAAAGRRAAARCHAQRRRDRDRREDARSRFPDLPDLQMGARSLWPRLCVRREAPSGRGSARTDIVRTARRQSRKSCLLRRHALSRRCAAL